MKYIVVIFSVLDDRGINLLQIVINIYLNTVRCINYSFVIH